MGNFSLLFTITLSFHNSGSFAFFFYKNPCCCTFASATAFVRKKLFHVHFSHHMYCKYDRPCLKSQIKTCYSLVLMMIKSK